MSWRVLSVVCCALQRKHLTRAPSACAVIEAFFWRSIQECQEKGRESPNSTRSLNLMLFCTLRALGNWFGQNKILGIALTPQFYVRFMQISTRNTESRETSLGAFKEATWSMQLSAQSKQRKYPAVKYLHWLPERAGEIQQRTKPIYGCCGSSIHPGVCFGLLQFCQVF